MVKNMPAMQEANFCSLGREDSVEEEMAIHSSILAWRIEGQKSLVGYSPLGSQRAGHDWATYHYHVAQRCSEGFPGGSVVKNLLSKAGDKGLIPGLGRSTCWGATKSMSHNYWACTLGPTGYNNWSSCSTREATAMRSWALQLEKSPHSSQPEKSPCNNKDPAQPEIKSEKKFYKRMVRISCFKTDF